MLLGSLMLVVFFFFWDSETVHWFVEMDFFVLCEVFFSQVYVIVLNGLTFAVSFNFFFVYLFMFNGIFQLKLWLFRGLKFLELLVPLMGLCLCANFSTWFARFFC